MFNFLDHLYFGVFSLIFNIHFLITFLIILLLPRMKFLTQLKKIYFVGVSAVFLFFMIYSLVFEDNVCTNYIFLRPNNCGFVFVKIDDSQSLSLSIAINRDIPSEDNGMTLGKKGSSFISKQETFYISIPLGIQFKDNDSLFFLESNKKDILNKVNDFMSFKDVKL